MKRLLQINSKKGIIQRFTRHEEKLQSPFYLPHRAVSNLGKSTSLQIFFDGSAKPASCASSINGAIYKGCNLLTDLAAVFLRLRLIVFAIVADIEKAFLQLGIADKARVLLPPKTSLVEVKILTQSLMATITLNGVNVW